MPRHRTLSTERDIPILQFIWKWKITTTAAIHYVFFRSSQKRSAYHRLYELSKMGVIESKIGEKRDGSVWVLTKSGFKAIHDTLPELREAGFRSEHIGHDLTVAAAHLGDWIEGIPDGCDLFTEQELRRFSEDEYREWVPQTPLHRPDGYWRVKTDSGHLTIALEVELTHKRLPEYDRIGRSYAYYSSIDRVIWVVGTPHLGRKIYWKISEVAPSSASKHSFIKKSDFQNLGWQAPIFLGSDKGHSLAKLLWRKAKDTTESSPTLLLLDTRRSYQISKACEADDPRKIPDCVPYTPVTRTPSIKTFRTEDQCTNSLKKY